MAYSVSFEPESINRVIYEFDIENQLIFVARVGHRREIY